MVNCTFFIQMHPIKHKVGRDNTVSSVAILNLPCTETPAPPPMTIPSRMETFSQVIQKRLINMLVTNI